VIDPTTRVVSYKEFMRNHPRIWFCCCGMFLWGPSTIGSIFSVWLAVLIPNIFNWVVFLPNCETKIIAINLFIGGSCILCLANLDLIKDTPGVQLVIFGDHLARNIVDIAMLV